MSRNTAFLFLFTVVCAVSLAACQPAAPAEPTPAPAMESTAPATSPTSDATESTRTLAPGEQMVSVETNYMSPGGEEQIGFTLFVDEEGVITAAETNVLGKSPTTVMRQKSFAAELPTVVTGKKLSELSDVDRVGGSSLTTGAFNKALTELKAQL